MTIVSNHHPRELHSISELPAAEREYFDYVDSDDDGGLRFFKYRGAWYDMNEFLRSDDAAGGDWDGYHTETAWSAVVVRLRYCTVCVSENCGEHVVVGYSQW